MSVITVEVGVDEFSNDDLIEELESRGFYVPEEPFEDHGLDKYELEWLLGLIDHAAPRTYVCASVRHKLHKLRYGQLDERIRR